MAVAAVVGIVIIKVMMTVQAVQTVIVHVAEVSKENFACFILKHQPYRLIRGRGFEICVAYDSADQCHDHYKKSYFQISL
jgi:hypothetical protein